MKTTLTIKTLTICAFLGSLWLGSTAQIIDTDRILLYKPVKADLTPPPDQKVEDDEMVFPDHDPSPYATPTALFGNNGILTAKSAIDTTPHYEMEAEPVLIEDEGESTQIVEITIYPNPATEILYIELSTLKGISIKLLDISGRLVLDQYIKEATYAHSIDLRAFENGVYILVVETNEMRDSRTVVIRS